MQKHSLNLDDLTVHNCYFAEEFYHFLYNKFPSGESRWFHFKVGITKAACHIFWTLNVRAASLRAQSTPCFTLWVSFSCRSLFLSLPVEPPRSEVRPRVCAMETPWLWNCRFTTAVVTQRSCWGTLGHHVLRLLHAQPSTATQTLCIRYNKWPSCSLNCVCVCVCGPAVGSFQVSVWSLL